MKGRMQFLYAYFALLICVLTVQSQVCKSGEITYSWAGQLQLHEDTSPDPWMIGKNGAQFILQTTINTDVLDQNDTQIRFAVFPANNARLWIDGEELTFTGNAYIDFTDAGFDLVTAGGLFTKLGQTVDISSVIGLDAETFSFDMQSETPPRFDSTTATTTGVSSMQAYVATVTPGALITIIPEPNTAFLLAFSATMIILGRTLV